jgi:hypothetical protein
MLSMTMMDGAKVLQGYPWLTARKDSIGGPDWHSTKALPSARRPAAIRRTRQLCSDMLLDPSRANFW